MVQVIATPGFLEAYHQLTPRMQKIVDAKIERLTSNPAHPSLKVHRLRQARAAKVRGCYISINKRLLYQYQDGKIYLWDVGEHDIVDRAHLRGFSGHRKK